MTPSEAETKRLKAIEFLRNIGNDDDADRFEDMSAADYAEHKGAQLMENPERKVTTMARGKSKADLQADLSDANDYINQLEAKLADIAGIANDEEEEEDDEDGDDDDGDDQDGDGDEDEDEDDGDDDQDDADDDADDDAADEDGEEETDDFDAAG